MTQRASVGQGDIERALKACKRAGYDRARIHINVGAGTIDIILGEEPTSAPVAVNPWDQDEKRAEGAAMLDRVKKRLAGGAPARGKK